MQSVKQENFFPVSGAQQIQIPVMRNGSSLCVCMCVRTRACICVCVCGCLSDVFIFGLCVLTLVCLVCFCQCVYVFAADETMAVTDCRLLFPAAVQLLHPSNICQMKRNPGTRIRYIT